MANGRYIGTVTLVVALCIAIYILALHGIRRYRRNHETYTLEGAVIKQSTDTRNQSPIEGVEVSADRDAATHKVTSDFSGYFSIPLRRGVRIGNQVTLEFRHPNYQPTDQRETVGAALSIIRMVPLHGEVEAELDQATMTVTNVLVRYSTQSSTNLVVGTGVTTFQAVNTGNVPCYNTRPCSPDGKWKASVASASLEAQDNEVFRNATVSCIAGPCPFTKIDHDGFSKGGRTISVTARDWSDTATFLLQAEAFRPEVVDTVRESFPVIFGRSMNFTVPGTAEGTSIEAELDGVNIVFPLGPNPTLSWADCDVRVDKNQVKDYRCELKAGYRFP